MYHSKEVTKKWSFRRKIKDEVHWVELVVHVFKEKFTDNIYALLYLKDIDSEKRQQLANEAEASRDPLTNVYNRRAFERKVVQYMAEKMCIRDRFYTEVLLTVLICPHL